MPGVWRMHAGVVRAELSTHADLKFTTQHVGGRKLAEIDFRNRRPWHSSPIIPMARDVVQNVCSAAVFHCPLGELRLFLIYSLAGDHTFAKADTLTYHYQDPGCPLMRDDQHIRRFSHACGNGFFCTDEVPEICPSLNVESILTQSLSLNP